MTLSQKALALTALTALSVMGALAKEGAALFPNKEFSFPATPGKVYEIQGSAAPAGPWQKLAGPLFAAEPRLRHTLSQAQIPPTTRHFRVIEIPGANLGPAPATLLGKCLTLVSQGTTLNFLLLDETHGVVQKSADSMSRMTYTYARSAADRAILNIQSGTRQDLVTLKFLSPGVGGFSSVVKITGFSDDDEAGTFALSDELPLAASTTALPQMLQGQELAVWEGGEAVRYQFDATTGLRHRAGAPPSTFSYSYDVQADGRGTLELISGNWRADITLRSDTEAAGSYQRGDSAGDAQTPSNPSTGPFVRNVPNPTFITPCPEDVSGQVFSLTDPNSGSYRMRFDDGNTGRKERIVDGTLEWTPFKYDFERQDATHARVVIIYPGVQGDEVEYIELTYNGDGTCTGTFIRKGFQNGQIASTHTGSFSGE